VTMDRKQHRHLDDGKRGRPRDLEARDAILAAALAAVREDGYGNVTMEGIAADAGVAKQTIYRWWASKADVVLDAVLADALRYVSVFRSADPRDDVRRFLVATFQRLKKTGPVVRGLMAHAQIDERFREQFRERFLAMRRAALAEVVSRAVPRESVAVMVDCLYGAVWYRLLDDHGPLDDAYADAFGNGRITLTPPARLK